MLPSPEACSGARAALARVEVGRCAYDSYRWRELLALSAVKDILQHALFVPTETPDEEQVRIVRHLLSVPEGGPSPVPWFDDLVTTTATILRLDIRNDAEGTDYCVDFAIDPLGTFRVVCYRHDGALQLAFLAPFGMRPQTVQTL